MLRLRRPVIFYGWVIVAACAAMMMLTNGTRGSIGAFIPAWQEAFNSDRGTVALVSAIGFLVYGLSLPVAGRICDRVGPRVVLSAAVALLGAGFLFSSVASAPWQLYLSFGILGSVGVGGASNVTVSVASMRWFTAQRGLAMGIITMGMAAGAMVVVPLVILGIDRLGWQPTIALMGSVLVLSAPVLALVLRNDPASMGLRPLGEEARAAAPRPAAAEPADRIMPILRRIVRMRAFWFLSLPYFVCGVPTAGIVHTHLVPHAYDLGFSGGVAATTMGVLAFANIAGTFLSGYLTDRWNRRLLMVAIYGLRGLTYLFLLTVRDPASLVFFGLIFGVVDFATIPPTSALSAEYFGRRRVGLVYGCISLFHQVGSAFGAYLSGWLFDQTGGYAVTFVLAAVLLFAASGLSLALPRQTRTPDALSPVAAGRP